VSLVAPARVLLHADESLVLEDGFFVAYVFPVSGEIAGSARWRRIGVRAI